MMTLAEWMEWKGLNQEGAAELFGVTRAYVSRLLSGKSRPSFELLKRIHKVTRGKVTAESFFDRHQRAA